MLNKLVQAAAEGLPKISRRSLLGGLAVMATPVAAAAAVKEASASKFDLQHWLDTADAHTIAKYHAGQLAEAMSRLDATRAFRFEIDHRHAFALIVGDEKKETRL